MNQNDENILLLDKIGFVSVGVVVLMLYVTSLSVVYYLFGLLYPNMYVLSILVLGLSGLFGVLYSDLWIADTMFSEEQ